MKKRIKRKFTETELARCWALWRSGLGYSDIARDLHSKPGTIFGVIRIHGGYAPPRRTRNPLHLRFSEREEISRGLAQKLSIRAIARQLNRSPSTILREIRRHGGLTRYRAHHAQDRALKRASRPKSCKLALNAELCELVSEKLERKWSPEQIAGWLRVRYKHDASMQISHETIYKSLYVQARGVLKKELLKHLRYGHKMRHTRAHSTRGDRGTIRIVNGLSIHARPPEVKDREIAGHWEGDLITGSGNSHVATLVERKSRYTLLAQVNGKDSESVVSAVVREIIKLPLHLRQSLTWDRGMEMAKHRELHLATNMMVYFCDPQSPWQRGTNENTNRLLRQYYPKKTPLGHLEQKDLDMVASELNERPRKTLGFLTPADVLSMTVALTG